MEYFMAQGLTQGRDSIHLLLPQFLKQIFKINRLDSAYCKDFTLSKRLYHCALQPRGVWLWEYHILILLGWRFFESSLGELGSYAW